MIGVVCGSASVFFLILGIIILFIQKKYNIHDISDNFSFTYSYSEEINNSDDNNSNIDYSELQL